LIAAPRLEPPNDKRVRVDVDQASSDQRRTWSIDTPEVPGRIDGDELSPVVDRGLVAEPFGLLHEVDHQQDRHATSFASPEPGDCNFVIR
jgi:hypothetical protein